MSDFRSLLSRGLLSVGPRALVHLVRQIVGRNSVPFRKRPTVKLRMVKMLRAHGLSFAGVVLLSAGRNGLPGDDGRTSFVPCGLHRTFNVAAVRQRSTMCTCCFCHVVRQTGRIAVMCGSNASNVGERRPSHCIVRLRIRFPKILAPCTVRATSRPALRTSFYVGPATSALRGLRTRFTCSTSEEGGCGLSPSTVGS